MLLLDFISKMFLVLFIPLFNGNMIVNVYRLDNTTIMVLGNPYADPSEFVGRAGVEPSECFLGFFVPFLTSFATGAQSFLILQNKGTPEI